MTKKHTEFQNAGTGADLFKFEAPGEVFTGVFLDEIEMEFDGKAEKMFLFNNWEDGEDYALSPYFQIEKALEAIHTINGDDYTVDDNREQLLFQFTFKEKTKTRAGRAFTRFDCRVALIEPDESPEEVEKEEEKGGDKE
jgi:hypothetical protein